MATARLEPRFPDKIIQQKNRFNHCPTVVYYVYTCSTSISEFLKKIFCPRHGTRAKAVECNSCLISASFLVNQLLIWQSAIVMTRGRPEGSKNSQGHAAGGARSGSGRKKKQPNDNQLSSQPTCKLFNSNQAGLVSYPRF